MRIALFGSALLAAGCTMEEPARVSPQAQAELAAAIQGRVAGPPQDCVEMRDLGSNRSVGDVLVFQGRGDLIYVNRPPGGCPSIGLGRALQFQTTMTRLCRGDIGTVFDPTMGASFGACTLGEFVPYRKVD